MSNFHENVTPQGVLLVVSGPSGVSDMYKICIRHVPAVSAGWFHMKAAHA